MEKNSWLTRNIWIAAIGAGLSFIAVVVLGLALFFGSSINIVWFWRCLAVLFICIVMFVLEDVKKPPL